jgi:hypothetical protein
MANDECWREYQKRPFLAEQHTAVVEDGRYRWGSHDVGAQQEFSAWVTLGSDGGCSEVTLIRRGPTVY